MLDRIMTVFRNRGPADPLAGPQCVDRGDIGRACFAMDLHGRGRAIWENNGRLWTTQLGLGLGPGEAMATRTLGSGHDPQIALNAGGTGVVVWMVRGPEGPSLCGLPLGKGKRQEWPSPIFTTSGSIRHLRLRVDRRGGAVLVWSHQQGGTFEILSKRFNARANAWDAEPARVGPVLNHPVEPRLALSPRGQAVVAWIEERKDARELMACLSGPDASPWGAPPVLLASGRIPEFQLAIDPGGNALGLFLQQDPGAPVALKARRYANAGSAWQEPEVLGSASHLKQVRLAMNGSGEALAVWLQGGGQDPSFLRSMAFRAGHWGDRETHLTAKGGKVEDFSVALGPGGQASMLVIAQQAEGHLALLRFLGTSGKEDRPVAESSSESMDQPMTGLCPKGTIALWRMGEGSGARLLCSRHGVPRS